MNRAVLAVDLKNDPDAIEAYKAHHRRVWPEVIRSLRTAGIRDMEIYLIGRRLVMIVETDGRDVWRCFAAHRTSHPRVEEWEALMQGMQEVIPGTEPGQWWMPMERVFHLRDQETASDAAKAAAVPKNTKA